MPRTTPLSKETAPESLKEIFTALEKKFGKVPNIFRHMANSPAVLKGFLGLSAAMDEATLSPQTREKIALVVAETNQCDYCLAAHTKGAEGLGIPEAESLQARVAKSDDPKITAILRFAKELVKKRGSVKDEDVGALKNVGVNDAELTEIIGVVVVNMFTNYFNHVIQTEIDFPKAPAAAHHD